MISDIKAADNCLADTLWWLHGFNAARSSSQIEGGQATVSEGLTQKVKDVRTFLERINEGRVRRLGEETAIVLTFAEWEKICDFLLIKPDSLQERDIAAKTVKLIHDQYRHQEQEYRRSKDDVPF